MTIRELIERLQAWPPDTDVYVMSGYDCDMPGPPEPEYRADYSFCTGVFL